MKCQKCGFVEIGEGKSCRLCGSPLQKSVLIHFPTSQEAEAGSSSQTQQGDWREELRERVEAIRARRRLAGAKLDGPSGQSHAEPSKPTDPSHPQNPMVEGAINRMRRLGAGEEKGSVLSEISAEASAKSFLNSSSDVSLRAMEEQDQEGASPSSSYKTGTPLQRPSPKTRTNPVGSTRSPLSSLQSPLAAAALPEKEPRLERQEARTDRRLLPPPYTATSDSGDRVAQQEERTTSLGSSPWAEKLPDAEFDDVDYAGEPASVEYDAESFEPLVNNMDDDVGEWSQGSNRLPSQDRIQAATLAQRFRSGIVDGLVLILVTVPFAALIELSKGDFADRKVQIVLLAIVFILHLFYMTMMLMAAGQTIGMMVSGILAVDARTMNLPSFKQSLGRALGFLAAAAPFCLGFLCPALDRQGRSISDLVSRTTVKQAFTDIGEARIPWVYYHGRS
jgi:uncharacterized RDD family membrane protein YckC